MRRRAANCTVRVLVAVAGAAPMHAPCAQELTLQMSRSLATPAPAAAPTPAAGTQRPRAAGAAAPSISPITLDVRPRGALFLRADRMEGDNTQVTAEGNVEIRSREQTVLADWINYNQDRDEIHAKGNVVLRQGFDWITGPELKFKRDTETGFFTAPRFN